MRNFILILGLLSFIMDWYAYQGVKKLTADWQSENGKKKVRWGYWVFFISFTVLFVFAVYQRFSNDVTTPFVQWMINAFLTLLVTKIVFVLVLVLEDIFRVFTAAIRLTGIAGNKKAGKDEKAWPGRRKAVSQLGLALASVPFFSFVYGTTIGKYNFRIHKHILYFPDLPIAFDGFRITQLSDIHAGSLDAIAEVERGLQLAQEQGSDLLIFTGDMVNDQASEILPFMKALARLEAPYGKFSILGNHDYGMYHDWESEEQQDANLAKLIQHQSDAGFRMLLDEHVSIEKDGEKLTLLGVENWGRGFIEKGDLDKALKGVDQQAFKILLSHDPSHWEEIVKSHPVHVHLTLSGHTHGMQMGIETPLIKWSPAQYRYKHWAGLKKENNRLNYINRGFGFIGFSGRVGIWPEITVLELKKGNAPS